MFVEDRDTGDTCLLSSDHVIASATVSNAGRDIDQPGRSDGAERPVADLLRWDRFTGSAVAKLDLRLTLP